MCSSNHVPENAATLPIKILKLTVSMQKKFASERKAPCLPADRLLFPSYLEQLARVTTSVCEDDE